jgi:hypothetical protein
MKKGVDFFAGFDIIALLIRERGARQKNLQKNLKKPLTKTKKPV